MAIFEWRSSEKPVDISSDGYGTCCGEVPEVLLWKKHRLVGVYCRNPDCEYHEPPVCAMECDIKKKWDQYRKRK